MALVRDLDRTKRGRKILERFLISSGLMDECKRLRDQYAHARGYYAEVRFPPRQAEFVLRLDWWSEDRWYKYSLRVLVRRVNGVIEVRINGEDLDTENLPNHEYLHDLLQEAIKNPLVQRLK